MWVKRLILFLIGASMYYLIEILYDGTSHLSMFIIGGLSFLIGGLINEYPPKLKIWKQSAIITTVIVILEYFTGWIVNIKLGLRIWDYSDLSFNLHGQISLRFALIWYFIFCPLIIWFDDYVRWKLFGEEKVNKCLFSIYKDLIMFK